MPRITQADLEARLSVATVKQILDDDNDGTADANAVTRILTDAQSYVDEGIEDLYRDKTGATWPLVAPFPASVIRLDLDAAEAYAAKRHPEYVRRDWQKLFMHVDAQIDRLRAYQRSLGETNPGPADGGVVIYTDTKRGW